MTVQSIDGVLFQGDNYSLIGIEGGDLAPPRQFGMEPVMISTACYRGFYAIMNSPKKHYIS